MSDAVKELRALGSREAQTMPAGWADMYDFYNDAADEIEQLRLRVAELEAAEWHVRHVDTMNDMVLLGLDRDEWKHRAEAAEARVAELEVLLTTARQLVTHAATELAQSAQDMSAMRAERALHKALAAIQEAKP